MKMYDVDCPNCGHRNRNLFLEDSGGWMECESCGAISRVRRKERERGCRPFPALPEKPAAPALKSI